MGVTTTIKRGRSPQYTAPLNQEPSIVRGASFVAHPARGIGLLDATGKSSGWTTSTGVERIATPSGLGLSFDGSTQYVSANSSVVGTGLPISQAFTLFSVAIPADTTTRGALLTLGNSTDSIPYWWLEVNATAGKVSFNVRSKDGGGVTATTSAGFTANQIITAVGRQTSNTNRDVFLNTLASKTNNTGLAGTSLGYDFDRTAIGTLLRSGTTTFFKGQILLSGVVLRDASDAEINEFLTHPWSEVFAPVQRSLWIPQAAAAPTFNAAWNSAANSMIQGMQA